MEAVFDKPAIPSWILNAILPPALAPLRVLSAKA